MKISFIRWNDSCYVDAANAGDAPAKAELSELCEIGFLLAESDDAVLLGMEIQDDDTHPGSGCRVSIPKASIVERRDREINQAFPVSK